MQSTVAPDGVLFLGRISGEFWCFGECRLPLGMAPTISIEAWEWNAALHELEDAFGVTVPAQFRVGDIDPELLLAALCKAAPDAGRQGQMVITYELRQSLASILAIDPAEITDATAMPTLLLSSRRKQLMQQLQGEVDWILPRLGMPVWAQYLWGAGLLIGFILQFIYPILGMILFWGGMLLSFQVEKIAWAFQYPTFGKWVQRVVALNWPSLELAGVEADRVRIVYAELLRGQWPALFDPRERFPIVLVQDRWSGYGPQWHVLNGDALRLTMEAAKVPGEHVVMRECMVVGPVQGSADFFAHRAAFIESAYAAGKDKYQIWVMHELQRLATIPPEADINLWFEDDLFCQVNLWFLIDQLVQMGHTRRIFRVLPIIKSEGTRWTGFANHDLDLLAEALQARILLIDRDLDFASAVWQAYQQNDLPQLTRLANTTAPQWRGLSEAVAAHALRQPDADGLGAPERILRDIQAEGKTAFEDIFQEFIQRAGVYGFGDLQVRALLPQNS